jgi:hypothetical protein
MPWVWSAELPSPSLSQSAAFLIGGRDHNSLVQSELKLPVLQLAPVTVAYRFRETTPFLTDNAQAQLLYSRHEVETALRLNDRMSLLALAGFHRAAMEDRPGSASAAVVGVGAGSPELDKMAWRVLAGAYLGRTNLEQNWWAEATGRWRILELPAFQSSLGLVAAMELAGTDGSVRGHYQIGPALEMVTANGNRAQLMTGWYFDDGHPFYGGRESALLLSFQVTGTAARERLPDLRETRPTGWLPLVWGQYDVAVGGDRYLQRFELDTEFADLNLLGHRITGRIWFESREEYRSGDFNNIAYSVSVGPQTELNVGYPGQSLVVGCDYLHRSAHALDPDASRVTPGTFLEHNSINVVPRFRLQTRGWDWPYRDPVMYNRQTRWLNLFDWRVTIGYDFFSSRDRPNPAAQLGLNWDAASIQGFVLYAHAVGSVGNETPDWLAEIGVRRPVGRLFFRAERYGLESQLARGEAFTAGVGFHL